MTHWIGIDPGQTGGVAFLGPEGELLDVIPMPVTDKQVQGGQLGSIIWDWVLRSGRNKTKVCIEQVHSMPKQGVASTFKFGLSTGIAIGVVQALQLPMHRLRPQDWKKTMGLTGKDKDASRALATELWPPMAQHWKFKNQDGKAEAALIAEAARRGL